MPTPEIIPKTMTVVWSQKTLLKTLTNSVVVAVAVVSPVNLCFASLFSLQRNGGKSLRNAMIL